MLPSNSRFFNSEWDDASDMNASHAANLCAIANRTVQVVWKWANSNQTIANFVAANEPAVPPSISVNCTFIAEMLDCFAKNLLCDALLFVGGWQARGQAPVQTYGNDFKDTPLSTTLFYLMSSITAKFQVPSNSSQLFVVCKDFRDCDAYHTCLGGVCINSATYTHDAYGSSLKFEDGSFKVVDDLGGTWTTSTFSNTQMRIFVAASDLYSGLTFAASILVLAFTFITTRLVRKRLQRIYKEMRTN